MNGNSKTSVSADEDRAKEMTQAAAGTPQTTAPLIEKESKGQPVISWRKDDWEECIALARSAVQSENWSLAEQRWREILERFPNQHWVRERLGEALLQQRRFDDACMEFDQLVERRPEHAGGYAGLARCVAWREDLQMSENLWRNVVKEFPDYELGHQGLGDILLRQGRVGEAEAEYAKAIKQNPDHSRGYIGLARCAEWIQDAESTERRWTQVLDRFPDNNQAIKGLGDLFTQQGRFDEARDAFEKLCQTYPAAPEGYEGLARLADRSHDHDLAVQLWTKAAQLFPMRLSTRIGEMAALLENHQTEKAEVLRDELIQRHPQREVDIWDTYLPAVIDDLSLDQITTIFRRVSAQNRPPYKIVNAYAKALCYAGEGTEAITLIRAEIDKCSSPAEDRCLRLRAMLAHHLLFLNQLEAATETIDRLSSVPDTQRKSFLTDLFSWRSERQDDIQQAQKTFFASNKTRTLLPLLKTDSHLRLITVPNSTSMADGSVVLVARLRNTIATIERFLKHYRELGIDRFVFVDNDSDDGTLEYLTQCPDAVVYHTTDSYGQAGSGMAWINQLIQRHSTPAHWCLFADLDEFIVYPHGEHRDIHWLTDYNKKNGYQAVSGFMLDMFPKNLKDWRGPGCGHFIDHALYFDNDYYFGTIAQAPYRLVLGGVRRRLFRGYSPYLTKAPIIRGGGDIKYLGSHLISPCSISDVSTVFLHYKLTPDFLETAEREIGRKQYWKSGTQWNQSLRYFAELQNADNIMGENSVRYRSSTQLLELGLLDCPANV